MKGEKKNLQSDANLCSSNLLYISKVCIMGQTLLGLFSRLFSPGEKTDPKIGRPQKLVDFRVI